MSKCRKSWLNLCLQAEEERNQLLKTWLSAYEVEFPSIFLWIHKKTEAIWLRFLFLSKNFKYSGIGPYS